MTTPDSPLHVDLSALPGIAGRWEAMRAAADPGPLGAVCAAGIAGLGGLRSAAVLAELAAYLTVLLTAAGDRFARLDQALGHAAHTYAAVEQALTQAADPAPSEPARQP